MRLYGWSQTSSTRASLTSLEAWLSSGVSQYQHVAECHPVTCHPRWLYENLWLRTPSVTHDGLPVSNVDAQVSMPRRGVNAQASIPFLFCWCVQCNDRRSYNFKSKRDFANGATFFLYLTHYQCRKALVEVRKELGRHLYRCAHYYRINNEQNVIQCQKSLFC